MYLFMVFYYYFHLQMNAVRAFVADMQAGVDRTDKDRDHVLTVTKHVLLDQLDKSDPPIVRNPHIKDG